MFGYDEVLTAARVAFTDRYGGASKPPYGEFNLGTAAGPDADGVRTNFQQVATEFGVRTEHVVVLHQVHGRDVHVVRPGDELPLNPHPQADALVTDRTDVVLAVRAADCLPVLLAGDGVIGAAHSGRRGMYAGVVPATVDAMRKLGASRITAVLGPYACGKCYEVPEEMRAEVSAQVPASYSETSWGTPAIDVAAGVRAQLAELDVEVIDATACTIESGNLYSYRREGPESGRLAGLIKLAGS
ncbi:peptidoglycan editing factor PgeF [Kribbella solani]|uniref:Purine nucleoside phosphorylase n=1 Tax=Kribbella solani TaxID=236067 RepID=A0A841DQI4_9ACTN|nr:peptidoglycan editing factor PgeF [Kribbella solani]MBB5979026.1 YfiH family protein [Kribbella solani]MDX3000256.1 peptidoglycan editing factor PgeF [Kribbella solani]